jgi:hypothetical protein
MHTFGTDSDGGRDLKTKALCVRSTLIKRNWQDLAVYMLVLLLGALRLTLSCRAVDFVGDAYYYELARSIVDGTGYGFNFKPQTMVAPGFPLLLSLLIVTVGSSYAVLVQSMAVFTTLALIATYEVLRSHADQACATVACLLLASSAVLFEFSTTYVFSDMPYLFTSMLLLWALPRVDQTLSPYKRIGWWLLCGALLLVSILMRSAGIALLGGILGWLAVSFFSERKAAKRRFIYLIPVAIIGISAQAAWMSWTIKHQSSEWPGYGYQENYLAQLKLKNGNNPELGLANWKDVLKRPIDNANDMAAAMVGLYSGKQTSPAWYSPIIVVTFLLFVGLGNSFRKTGGGLLEWYLVSYQAMFLFWPWDFELRFFLPVAPLAFLYTWRGAILLWRWARNKMGWVGLSGLVIAAAGCLGTVLWGWEVPKPQARWCISAWLLFAVISMMLWWGGRKAPHNFSLLGRTIAIGGRSVKLPKALGYILVTCLFVVGIAMQLKIGLANLHSIPEADPDVEAAEWIGTHSAPSTVIMARKEDLAYHYSQRKVIWLPPSSNAQILMEGIRKYHVDEVVVIDREYSYWKPSEAESFRVLYQAYPGAFVLIHEGRRSKVFAVVDGHS